LLLAVLVVCGLAACSGPASAQTGDCVERTGDGAEIAYSTVDCAGAQLRVLERQEDLSGDCETVGGVTEGYADFNGEYRLCIGPRDVDPATGVNIAQVGACLTGVDATSGQAGEDVRQVPCTDASAGALVLSRTEGAFPLGNECSDVPGSTATYTWSFKETGGTIPDIGTDLLFCLGPPGVDPQTSPDTAQTGDCISENGGNYTKVDCAAPEATYRVVQRVENSILPIEMACTDPATTFGLQRQQGFAEGYALCLAPR
jgi:hypothetical protein